MLRDADRSEFDGKLVVVGASARALGDVHPTAYGDGRSMSGAEIHANAISTLLRGRPLRELHPAADIALIVLLGLAPALLLIAAPRWAALLVAVVAVAYLALAQAVFGAGRIVPVVNPLLALVAAAVAVVAVRVAIRRRALVDL